MHQVKNTFISVATAVALFYAFGFNLTQIHPMMAKTFHDLDGNGVGVSQWGVFVQVGDQYYGVTKSIMSGIPLPFFQSFLLLIASVIVALHLLLRR